MPIERETMDELERLALAAMEPDRQEPTASGRTYSTQAVAIIELQENADAETILALIAWGRELEADNASLEARLAVQRKGHDTWFAQRLQALLLTKQYEEGDDVPF